MVSPLILAVKLQILEDIQDDGSAIIRKKVVADGLLCFLLMPPSHLLCLAYTGLSIYGMGECVQMHVLLEGEQFIRKSVDNNREHFLRSGRGW